MKIFSIVLNNFINDSRVIKESKTLTNAGHEVFVLALHEERLSEREEIDGFNVFRLRLLTRRLPKNLFFQFFKYLEFLLRVLYSFRNADVYHCNDISALPIGVLVKLINREVKVVYDAHEYQIEVKGCSGILKKIKFLTEKILLKYVDVTLTVSDSIANEYVRLYGIDKPKLVLNCPSYTKPEGSDFFRLKFNIPEQVKVFLYQGGLSSGRGIELMLEAFSHLNNRNSILVVMGDGPLKENVIEYTKLNSNIYYHSAVGLDVLPRYTESADFGILFYEDVCLNHRYCSPNKMFEYLMAGLPVVVSNLFEMKRLVKKFDLGVVAKSNDVSGFSSALEEALDIDYFECRESVLRRSKEFTWEKQEVVLLGGYNEL